MELNSLYYFTELAKDLHVTRTAERLYISQQTLSNHIARLEEHYGAKLFYRKPIFSLTPFSGSCWRTTSATWSRSTSLGSFEIPDAATLYLR